MRLLKLFSAFLVGLGSAAAFGGQIDSSTYFLLQRGMSESEVLVRAGRPDLATESAEETTETFTGTRTTGADGIVRFDTVTTVTTPHFKEWHYIPDRNEHDPFITVISFRAGKVWEIERTKVFSRANLPRPGAEPVREVRSDETIRRSQAERTLDAAERYARTRARIKAQAANAAPEAPVPSNRRVYRRVAPDGAVYYGDLPPGSGTGYVDVD